MPTLNENRRPLLLAVAALLLVLLGVAAWWVLRGGGGAAGDYRAAQPAALSNPALDVRLTYDAGMFKPGAYDDRAEFPLRLDGEGFSLFGKRIRGVGSLLVKDPGPLLYDFVATEHEDVFAWYRLEPAAEPVYEDAQLTGGLGVHSTLAYRRGDGSPGWPEYFPASVQAADTAYVEGWATFAGPDLFYYYAIGDHPLTADERQAVVGVLNSVRYGAVLGGAGASDKP